MSNVTHCEMCCTLYSWSVSLGNGWELGIFGLVNAIVAMLMLCALVIRMAYLYRQGMNMGYVSSETPVVAIRAKREGVSTRNVWILPWYYGYVFVIVMFLFLQVILGLPDGGPVMVWIGRLLCGVCEGLDLLLVLYLVVPRVTTRGTLVVTCLALFIGGVTVMFVILTHDSVGLPWLTFNYPTTSIAYLYLIEGTFMFCMAMWARFRPCARSNPRPALGVLGLFWVPIYLGSAISLIFMHKGYWDGSDYDWGYCVLSVIVTYYNLFFVPVLYWVIINDSKWVLTNRLHKALDLQSTATDAFFDNNGAMQEEAEFLLRDPAINEQFVEVLQDASISLIASKELILLKRVGAGSFGSVWQANWNGTMVALKKLHIDDEMQSSSASAQVLAEFALELKILAALRHPNCLLLIGMVVEKGNLCLVSEYCSKGSLWQVLRSSGGGGGGEALDWGIKTRIILELASAMEYLHGHRILHRDLKSPNVLLTADMHVRVADFGMSRVKRGVAMSTMTGMGTTEWTAPEALVQEKNEYPFAADVWSFGIIVWELLTEAIPYQGYEAVQVALGVIQRTLSLDLNAALPDAPAPLKQIFMATYVYESGLRPSFKEIRVKLEEMEGVHE